MMMMMMKKEESMVCPKRRERKSAEAQSVQIHLLVQSTTGIVSNFV